MNPSSGRDTATDEIKKEAKCTNVTFVKSKPQPKNGC